MTQKEKEKKSKFPSTRMENTVFNRATIRKNRDQAAANFSDHAFLVREITDRLVDNLLDIRREFQNVVSIQADVKVIEDHFKTIPVIYQDGSFNMIKNHSGLLVQADEEYFPYKNQSLDLILSCLSLHWVNDLPGTLTQFLQCLTPDGLFMGVLFGGETLKELRGALMTAEMELRGGVSPHVSPFLDVKEAGALLQRAGFALPVASTETITVNYENMFSLMKELKAMGEQNSLMKRFRGLTHPELMLRAAEIYQISHADIHGRIPATFEILYLQGWAPHESQQKPLKPGSAKMPLKDALGATPPPS